MARRACKSGLGREQLVVGLLVFLGADVFFFQQGALAAFLVAEKLDVVFLLANGGLGFVGIDAEQQLALASPTGLP